MASYGNSLVATNVSIQRPMKMNWQTGLATGTGDAPFTLVLKEDSVVLNGTTTSGIGLQTHAAYEVAFQAPATAADTPELQITFPGTTGSSAYKPQIEVVRTTTAQYGTTTGEDHYVVRANANQYNVVRVSRNSPGTGVAGTVRVFIRMQVNTDALQPNT
jgi:hypothetical protein